MRRLALSLLTLAAALALPRAARAGNELHPRTPVDWTGAPCMTIIDRSQSDVYPLVYSIPYEDTMVTPDEVEQSRTHQFFGFCRDHHREDILPSWITEADLGDADAAGLGSAAAVDTELEALENSPIWAGCWIRINADEDRRPITFAAAAEPVMWDVSTLATGAWAVEGYTYEPWANEWWPHPGVFKIIDDPDPAATGPAAALNFPEQIVEHGDEALISGCVDAMPGATMTASWAISGFGSAPQWQVFAADMPVRNGMFELGFAPPVEAISNTLLIKLDVEDPSGRSWTAHANNYIAVTEDFGDDESCGGSFVSCETDDGDDETETDAGGGEESSDEGGSTSGGASGLGAQDAGEGGSCSCATATEQGPRAPLGLGVLLVAAALRLRPRRGW